jgi:hypothetical protein
LKCKPDWPEFTSSDRVLGRGIPICAKTADETTDDNRSDKGVGLTTAQVEENKASGRNAFLASEGSGYSRCSRTSSWMAIAMSIGLLIPHSLSCVTIPLESPDSITPRRFCPPAVCDMDILLIQFSFAQKGSRNLFLAAFNVGFGTYCIILFQTSCAFYVSLVVGIRNLFRPQPGNGPSFLSET